MKKMKLALIAVALFAIGSAFAPISKAECEAQQQYIPNGSGGFTPVTVGNGSGQVSCIFSSDICTYYQPDPINHPELYEKCKDGTAHIN
jgi:hypothetical protein